MTKSWTNCLGTLGRWRDVLIFALVGALIFAYLSQSICDFTTKWLIRFFGEGSELWGLASAAIVSFIGLSFLHHAAHTRIQYLRYILVYPPLPVAVLLGIFIIPALPSFSSGLLKNETFTFTNAATLAGAYALIWLFQTLGFYETFRILRKFWRHEAMSNEVVRGYSDEWLSSEKPISKYADDLFAHGKIADRILDRLTFGEVTIALQGDFGSGKSGVCNLASVKARERNLPLIFVRASCWGFEDSKHAQKEVLETILSEVQKNVDCLAIRQLPDDYIDALTDSPGWVQTLFHLGCSRLSPLEQLRRLSPILQAIGKRVLVVIEDVDRSGQNFDLSQIQAMLMQFREVPRLSFILAISPLQRIDFFKLCDHLEIMPDLEDAEILRILHDTREMLLKKHPPGILLTKLDPLVSEDEDYLIYQQYLGYMWPWQLALCEILRRPRILKHALRYLCETWPRLKGEVHFDHLLSVATLRAGAPEALAFLCSNFKLFKPANKQDHNIRDDARIKLKKELEEGWTRISLGGTYDQKSAATLLKEIYPSSAGVTGVSGVSSPLPQSMQSDRRGDVYARRLFTGNRTEDEVSDQTLLAWMQQAGTEVAALKELAEAITDSKATSLAFEDLSGCINFDQDLPLLTQIYETMRKRHGSLADSGESPGFFAPWRRALNNLPKDFEPWLISELEKCIPRHLRLLGNIYYYWLGTDSHNFQERLAPRNAIMEGLKAAWPRITPDQLVAGFDPSYPYTLFHLIYTSDYEKPVDVPLGKAEDWSWSGPFLYEAAKHKPSIMLPQILIALNKDIDRGREVPKYTLDAERLETLFGGTASPLISLIASGIEVSSEISEQTKYLLKQGVDAARNMGRDTPNVCRSGPETA